MWLCKIFNGTAAPRRGGKRPEVSLHPFWVRMEEVSDGRVPTEVICRSRSSEPAARCLRKDIVGGNTVRGDFQ